MHSFLVDLPDKLTKLRPNEPLTVPRILANELKDLFDQSRFIITNFLLIALCLTGLVNHTAGPALGNGERALKLIHRGAFPIRAYQFPS